LDDQISDLQLTCLHLADQDSVFIEGLVHELHPNIPPHKQEAAAQELEDCINFRGPEAQVDVAAAGAIPPLVRLRHESSALVQGAAANALCSLAYGHADNQDAIAEVGAFPRLVQLLGAGTSDVQVASAQALANLAAWHDGNQSFIVAGAVPPLVQLVPGSSAVVQQAAADALSDLAAGHADNAAAIVDAGAIPRLVQLLGPEYRDYVRKKAAWALHNLAAGHCAQQAAISAAGAVPSFELLLGPGSSANMKAAAVCALWNMAALHINLGNLGNVIHSMVQLLQPFSSEVIKTAAARALFILACDSQSRVAMVGAGAIPLMVQLLGLGSSAPYAQQAAADVLCRLAAGHAGNRAAIAAAGAQPVLAQLQRPGTPAPVQRAAAALGELLQQELLHHLDN
jgi:HEAT repeat protein